MPDASAIEDQFEGWSDEDIEEYRRLEREADDKTTDIVQGTVAAANEVALSGALDEIDPETEKALREADDDVRRATADRDAPHQFNGDVHPVTGEPNYETVEDKPVHPSTGDPLPPKVQPEQQMKPTTPPASNSTTRSWRGRCTSVLEALEHAMGEGHWMTAIEVSQEVNVMLRRPRKGSINSLLGMMRKLRGDGRLNYDTRTIRRGESNVSVVEYRLVPDREMADRIAKFHPDHVDTAPHSNS